MPEHVQLDLIMTGMTHRPPTVLFKQAVKIDHLSGGKLILAVGAAWNECVPNAYGLEFPSANVRVDRFGDAMDMYRLLEPQEQPTFEEERDRLVDDPDEPKPVRGLIPGLIGSIDERMLQFVAHGCAWHQDGPCREESRKQRARGSRVHRRDRG